MKVFISWSGEKSKEIATAIRNWLPSVIQAVKPYFSPDDIAKGARWATEIATELGSSQIGLLILTADNVEAPWLLFEAGALSKNLQLSKVVPLLFGLEPSDVKGPLVQFQGAKFGRDEMLRVIRMMNGELGETSLNGSILDDVFDMWWPRLEKEIIEILAKPHGPQNQGQRSERDMLEEILALSRSFSTEAAARSGFSPAAIRDLERCYSVLVTASATIEDEALAEAIRALSRPVRYLSRERADRRASTLGAILRTPPIDPEGPS